MTDEDPLVAERREVLELLDALTADYADIVAAQADVATDDEHDPEGSTIAFERQRVSDLAAAARDRLADTDRVTELRRTGDYGICVRCGRPIDPERLEARPTATTCITCASA
ncbi:MAG: TraR/DksA C4-type zinc finger protein [Frankiales bacterium]|nr:TraR/DksA C4-type zinc finger protein [Frankiales bacterium]